MSPQEFYQTFREQQQALLRVTSRTRNWITVLKLLCFAALVFCLYRLVATYGATAWIWCGAGTVAAFILLTVWDNRVAARIIELKTLIRCCDTESDYLNGKTAELDTGVKFLDPGHPYSLDLDLFGEESLFQALNRTVTPQGTQRLVRWLLAPCQDPQRITHRQQAGAELASQAEWMLRFRTTGMVHEITGNDDTAVRRWLDEPRFFKYRHARKTLYLSNAVSISLWIAAFFSLIPYGIPGIALFIQLGVLGLVLKRINRLSRQTDRFLHAVGTYNHLVARITATSFSCQELQVLQHTLTEGRPAEKALRTLNRILSSFDQRNNVLVAVILNGIYLKDLHHILQLDRWRENYRENVSTWLDTIQRFDALVSMGTYRFNHPDYCTPVLSDDILLQAEEMGHPLLNTKGKVSNDFEVRKLHDLYIVTGANMAGKSTFLRTAGVNLVLALSGNVVCSRTFACRTMSLFTSMRTTDNLAKGTSYFHAELLRLQQLVATAEHADRLFIILDEMLKGTNSQDKLNGSLKFLTRLRSLPVAGLIATHDLALGELAKQDPQHFHNVCFEIEHAGEKIIYDYKLRPGVSRNMNASILLQQMGLI